MAQAILTRKQRVANKRELSNCWAEPARLICQVQANNLSYLKSLLYSSQQFERGENRCMKERFSRRYGFEKNLSQ